MVYKNIDEIPANAKHITQRLIATGIIQYENGFEFPLNDDMLHLFIILSRIGII